MNTPVKEKFSIFAAHLGPILQLNVELTKKDQNLVFARNGTGKSFLSRTFRCLDLYGQGTSLVDAPLNLVSDESPDGTGAFSFGRGNKVMGSLQLDKVLDQSVAQLSDTIFHVFSEDFIQEELRELKYNIDSEIQNQILVDGTHIETRDGEDSLAKAEKASQIAHSTLKDDFDRGKTAQLIEKAGIRRQLKEYGALQFDELLVKFPKIPEPIVKSLSEILKDLDYIKSIPAEPTYPEFVNAISLDDIDLVALKISLNRITSPSSVSKAVKQKIEAHRDFYKAGIDIINQEHLETCPLCEQGISSPDPRSVIDAYIEYFSDEEARRKSELREFYGKLINKDKGLIEIRTKLARQKSHYDALKVYIPSMRDTSLSESEGSIEAAGIAISEMKCAIEDKAKSLGLAAPLPGGDLALHVDAINQIVNDNNKRVSALGRAVSKLDDERKKYQREACGAFEQEFAIFRWSDIVSLRALQEAEKEKAAALAVLKHSCPSANARARVADSFELLLKAFFGEKYIFDKNTFVLKRGEHAMARGPHRTLSDGEKTTIAFCYFVACVHRKVKSNSDYGRLFLVFDDPITSMSYDFIYGIAQTLKNLNISNQGEVSVNPGNIDGNKSPRPEILVLTHSSYFFNILVANRVVDESAAFALHCDKGVHKLSRLNQYVAPFQEQLKDVYEIANGRDPDHSTANAIRSVLEAVGRFCRPDKSSSLTVFVQHLAAADGIILKSVLINSFSHGTYYDEMPSPDDLKLACIETLQVVDKYAVGQIEVLKGIAAAG